MFADQCALCLCAASSDNERILLGGEDGLFMLEITDDGAHRLGDKKVVQIEVIKEEASVVYLGGGCYACVCHCPAVGGVCCLALPSAHGRQLCAYVVARLQAQCMNQFSCHSPCINWYGTGFPL